MLLNRVFRCRGTTILRPAALVMAMGLLACWAAHAVAGENLGRSKNYLIVTASDYYQTTPLNQLVAHKAGMGFKVTVHSVASGTDRTVIKEYIRNVYVASTTPPDYLLIVGDTDGSSSTHNTIPHWVGGGSRQATTDLPYVCMDSGDDWYPEFPVGRFSVRDTTQLQAVVDKTILVETENFSDPTYVKRAAFLATNDMTSGAEETHNEMIETYMTPNEYESTKVYARLGGGTSDITEAVNRGCVFAVYFGHSGSSGWSTPYFTQSNVQNLSNAGLYGLVFGFSCNTAHYDYDECFGETWLRAANKGAAVYLSASNYVWWGEWSEWESSRRMETYFFESFFVKGIWEVGPAWQAACYELLADPDFGPAHDHTRNIFEEFVVLGDPSLRLPRGDGFSLHVDPADRDLCAPPTDETTYAINVEKHGDFSEPVTLSVTGTPPGATVDFSVNGQAPPFDSVLTLGNLTAGSPGHYAIQIEGASASKEDVEIVSLNLSTAAPGAVELTSPPNGAVDVPRRPTLQWAAVSQTTIYDVEIATDDGFANVVYAAQSSETSHAVVLNLDTDLLYYWRVRAVNGCGDSGYSAPFAFTTVAVVDYFTQEFSNGAGFGLLNKMLVLTPNGSGNVYAACIEAITALPTDPAGGTTLSLDDDDSAPVTLNDSRTVELYGLAYTTFHVGSNGYVTFTAGDGNYLVSLEAHFNLPRISALFADLNPETGGSISWKQLDDRAAVTWSGVPMWGTSNYITMQIEMLFNGEIHIAWINQDPTRTCLTGLSEGYGTPSDFEASDLAAYPGCAQAGDMNCDGVCDLDDVAPFVLALLDPTGYEAAYPNCDILNGDLDRDGALNGADIAALVEKLVP